jgi:hypothetical protein
MRRKVQGKYSIALIAGLVFCVIVSFALLWNYLDDPKLDDIPLRIIETTSNSILFLGDTHPGENYFQEYPADSAQNILESRGYPYSFNILSPLVMASGLAIANLETPVTVDDGGLPRKSYNHWSSVTKTPSLLGQIGIQAVALANNHAMDQRKAGLVDTIDALDQAQIAWFGAGIDAREAYSPIIIRHTAAVGGEETVTAIISVFEYWKKYDREYRFYAGRISAGVAMTEMDNIRKVVGAIRNRFPDALIIGFPHWGPNYRWRTKSQKRLGHQFIDAGIDLVVGHGAHNFQEIEQYRERLILYGIGNFVFNSHGRYQKFGAHHFSLMAKLDYIGADGRIKLRLYPIISDNLLTDYQPRYTTEEEFADSLNLMLEKSSELGKPPEIRRGQDSFGYFFEINLRHDASPPDRFEQE